ncbi:MAG TPA: hypothetical protein VE781_00965 [Kineosporiaceae bacterium]|nr:hypothetical protein [Kineosporiaceae bacterium]
MTRDRLRILLYLRLLFTVLFVALAAYVAVQGYLLASLPIVVAAAINAVHVVVLDRRNRTVDDR